MGFFLTDERIRRDMTDLTNDLITLYEAKYPRFYNAIIALPEEKLVELMIELSDVFDLYRELTAEVARQYKEHRMESGSIEDRDWPEN